jgi:hypothetical protein
MSRYEIFDRSRLLVKPLAERTHDLQLDHWMPLDAAAPPFEHAELPALAVRIAQARASAPRASSDGAHVLRRVNRHLIDPWRATRPIAMNGAGAIHDYELARFGATTESVDRYIRTGESGCGAKPVS